MRILIGSPVRKPPNILKWFLWGLDHLNDVEAAMDWVFVDDNEHDASSEMLAKANNRRGGQKILAPEVEGKRPEFQTSDTRIWKQSNLDRVTLFREMLLREARAGGYDYLFLVDADLVLRPQSLQYLVAANKAIVSEVFWTRWDLQHEEMPNVWVADHYNLFEQSPGEHGIPQHEILRRQTKFLEMLRKPGLYRVGGLGACTLISRGALQGGISYQPLYNLTWWGEDRHFCLRAVALGFELWADTHCPPFHIYRQADLAALGSWAKGAEIS